MKTQAFIFDVDGTIADCSHRLHFIDGSLGVKDWDAFYDACKEDEPITNVMRVLITLENSYEIIFITGRPERVQDITCDWLDFHMLLRPYQIFMRKDGDHRPDYQVKREIYETQIKDKYDVIGVFEDRDQCVQMWRDLGLQCYQVNEGNY